MRSRVFVPVVVIAAIAAAISWLGVDAIGWSSLISSFTSAGAQMVGPVMVVFVALVFAAERRWPAQARPALARGHVHDGFYFVLHAAVVVPLVVLLDAGFVRVIARVAPWIELPRFTAIPRWVFVVVALVAMDFSTWFAHWLNHRVFSLWRLHAVHHTQEEMSVLTSFRTHPLVNVIFLVQIVPILVLQANGVVPVVALTAFICLAMLPHANVRWGFGPFGRVLVSPAFHRVHHSVDGRIDVNLGTILTVWDVMTHRAVFPERDAVPVATGLAQRPIPVEQAGARPRHARTLAVQMAEPFVAPPSAEPAAAMASGGQLPAPVPVAG